MSHSFCAWGCITIAAAVGIALGSDPRPDIPVSPTHAVPAVSNSSPSEDPFPIYRLRASETQLPDVLKQLEAGPVVHLTRNEFESRVRSAARAAMEAQNLPRVTDARYRASLI